MKTWESRHGNEDREMNTLFYGDNLQVLRNRDYFPDESVDLVYLDPPFNSNASYNVLFREQSGENSPAQIKAFTDTWEWTLEAERTFEEEIIEHPGTPPEVKEMISAFRQFIGRNAMMAYLVMMTPRLVELRRVLKPTGSLYLHCDPTASHYLKLLLDTIFGAGNFRNEISWVRSNPKSNSTINFPNSRDIILRYSKSNRCCFNKVYREHDPEYVRKAYKYTDPDGRRYRLLPLLNPNDNRPNLTYEFLGVTRVWRWTKERMQQAYDDGIVVQLKPGAVPQYKLYLDDSKGKTVTNNWDDIPQVSGNEALNFDTQKPLALLERIIQASSNEGDVVLDPFCGCGTAVAAAERLGRQWAGIDVTHLAVALMKNRLKTMFELEAGVDYAVVGEPRDVGGARALWEQDPYQFQFWAVSLLEAQPQDNQRRGADRGIDGLVHFVDGPRRTLQRAVVQVKGGRVSSPQIRDLKGVVEREKAALGLFICLEEPTRDMRTEEAAAGFYNSHLWQRNYPKIQIRTIEDLLAGRGFETPMRQGAYQAATRVRPQEGEQGGLGITS